MNDEADLIVVTMGCKEWSAGTQRGLRIYTPTIHNLTAVLELPSLDGRWASLTEFIYAIRAGIPATPYSRALQVVRAGYPAVDATMTIARHGRTTQGYITAPRGTWLYRFVSRRMNRDIFFQYASKAMRDVLVVPARPAVGAMPDPDAEARRMKIEIERSLQRENRPPPSDAKVIGLYFEHKEVERIRSEGLTPIHRYPSIRSSITKLSRADISCDIDVIRPNRTLAKCVEVKAVAGATGAEFHLTPKEHASRIECSRRNWIYEIIVYYHVGELVIERVVLGPDSPIYARPSGYWCGTIGST